MAQITVADRTRLWAMADMLSHSQDMNEGLDALLERIDLARVVPAERVGTDVVTMNSRVVLQDRHNGDAREITIVYPPQADAQHGRVSVLSPVGCAVLGASVGDELQLELPHGRKQQLRVTEIRYQPEAAGNFDL